MKCQVPSSCPPVAAATRSRWEGSRVSDVSSTGEEVTGSPQGPEAARAPRVIHQGKRCPGAKPSPSHPSAVGLRG